MDNLTRCSTAAIEAGMSYGKYMAMRAGKQPEVSAATGEPDEPFVEIDNMGRIPCKECGKLFYPLRKGNVFCSSACSSRMRSRERYRKLHGICTKEVKRG